MEYPKEFDKIARAKIVAAEILASREMYGAWLPAQSDVPLAGTNYRLGTTRFFQYIMSIFAAFANEACVLGRVGVWPADRIDREAREFLRLIAIEAEAKYSERADLHIPNMTDKMGKIDRPVMEHLETYPEWQHFQRDLLEVAKAHSRAGNLGALARDMATLAHVAGSAKVSPAAPPSAPSKDSRSGPASDGGPQAAQEPGSSNQANSREGPHAESKLKSAGRPKLPAEALQNIIDAEKAATEELDKALADYLPSNPKFVYQPVEINAGCWKVIEHLTTFAAAIFNAQAREYVKHYPALVLGGDLLSAEVGPEVVRRTKLRWNTWEDEVERALLTRWSFEHYRAYAEEGNQPGSEDQKLLEHFFRRLDEAVADRTNYWQEQAEAGGHESPPKPEHTARTIVGEPSSVASEPPVASEGAADAGSAAERTATPPVVPKARGLAPGRARVPGVEYPRSAGTGRPGLEDIAEDTGWSVSNPGRA